MRLDIKVVELFAGVGGFRLGLEGWNSLSPISGYKSEYKSPYKVVWSNQWEPSTKRQDASEVYITRFGNEHHSNENIEKVPSSDIPDHDLLVGGFPCQDYSVATTLKNSGGLKGKKGVLWWSIERILREKSNPPKYLILENVDRLLASPAKQRGRDFAVMLTSLNNLGYAVEWRVINAADYGFPQRRKRVFLVCYRKGSIVYDKINHKDVYNWITCDSIIGRAFSSNSDELKILDELLLPKSILEASNNFNIYSKKGIFKNAGFMIDGRVFQLSVRALYNGKRTTLKDIILDDDSVHDDYFLSNDDFDKWKYLKGGKKELRVHSSGYEYNYTEGKMRFPDSIDEPSRTIVTGEGGKSPSRFKHVIKTSYGFRRLIPIELERLNMFPDDFTRVEGIPDTKRAFFMGNALVVGVVELIGRALSDSIYK